MIHIRKPLSRVAALALETELSRIEARFAGIDASFAVLDLRVERCSQAHAQRRRIQELQRARAASEARRTRIAQARGNAAMQGLIYGLVGGLAAIGSAAHDARPALGLPELGGRRR